MSHQCCAVCTVSFVSFRAVTWQRSTRFTSVQIVCRKLTRSTPIQIETRKTSNLVASTARGVILVGLKEGMAHEKHSVATWHSGRVGGGGIWTVALKGENQETGRQIIFKDLASTSQETKHRLDKGYSVGVVEKWSLFWEPNETHKYTLRKWRVALR
jgi:hypothetical protein